MNPAKAKEWIEVLREGLSLIPRPQKQKTIKPKERIKTKKFSLKGKCIVVTGTISMHRPEFERKLQKSGAKLGKSVTHNTDLLIVGMKPGKVKISNAKEKSIPIVTWAKFLRMISQ